jgi:hypothetical protein
MVRVLGFTVGLLLVTLPGLVGGAVVVGAGVVVASEGMPLELGASVGLVGLAGD